MTQDETWLLKEKYLGKETADFVIDCERLARGEPLAYIIGSIPFLHTTIFLDTHPLIPRTETEFWVEKIITEIQNHRGRAPMIQMRALDLCAGSGCIGVALLKNIPNVTVDFVEIDTVHHTTILKNIRENGIDETRTHIYGGNLYEELTQTYDIIFSNPPYIDPVTNDTDANVLVHEPTLALFGGENGLELIQHIITDLPHMLTPTGIAYIEHDPQQSTSIREMSAACGYTSKTCTDQFGLERYTHIYRKAMEDVSQ